MFAHHLGDARVGLLLGDPLLLHLSGQLALGDGAGLLQRGVDEFLVDVLDHDRDVGGGDRLGDLPTHRAPTDDGGLAYEHSTRSSLLLWFWRFGWAAGGRANWEAICMDADDGSETPDRDELLAFELGLDERVVDEVHREPWGRLFLTPSAPLIWDANWVGIEQVGLSVDQVVAIADDALGGEGFGHRTVCAARRSRRQAGSARRSKPSRRAGPLGGRAHPLHGLARRRRRSSSQKPADSAASANSRGAREVRLAEIEGLRKALIAESMPADGGGAAAVDQLYELDRRYGEAAGDRWFVAPAEGEPMSACRLLRGDGIGQVEEVGTLTAAPASAATRKRPSSPPSPPPRRPATRRSSSPPRPPTGRSSSTPGSASRRSARSPSCAAALSPAAARYIWDTAARQRLYGWTNLALRAPAVGSFGSV